MRKRNVGMCLAVAALFGLPGLVEAQTVAVTATVPTSRTITNLGGDKDALAFGNVTPGGDPVAVTRGSTAGAEVRVNFNATTLVTVTGPASFGDGAVTLTYTCGYDDTTGQTVFAGDATSATNGTFTCATGRTFNVTDTALQRFISIGGSASAASNALPDTYNGTITITLAAP
jgi:hypothetical protein